MYHQDFINCFAKFQEYFATRSTAQEKAARHLEQTRLNSSQVYTEEFSVNMDLMGLAIGSQGANIQQARKIDGVHNIELTEDGISVFKVEGLYKYI